MMRFFQVLDEITFLKLVCFLVVMSFWQFFWGEVLVGLTVSVDGLSLRFEWIFRFKFQNLTCPQMFHYFSIRHPAKEKKVKSHFFHHNS